MSKLHDKYLKLKKDDSSKMYLFESDKFYIFIDEDAENISKITTLKLTNLTNDVLKCGFPSISIDKYLDIFNNLKIKYYLKLSRITYIILLFCLINLYINMI